MNWKKLQNFQGIFNREDFNYISDESRIKVIRDSIELLASSNEDSAVRINLIQEYLSYLASFYNWVGTDEIPALNEGFATCEFELLTAIGLYKESAERRLALVKKIFKIEKWFLKGLDRLYKGVRKIFDPREKSLANIEPDQISRYIFDKTEGLGSRFLFNRRGVHAFVNKIFLMNKQELEYVLHLLISPHFYQKRSINKWRDLGSRRDPVRILVQHHWFSRNLVCFLYKANEHREYEDKLAKPPNNAEFDPI